MVLTPRYIQAADIGTQLINFQWDDWRASQDFTFDASTVLERMTRCSLRAKIGLGIGMYEWIVWRFQSLSEDATPFQVAEAAWCANIDQRYMEYSEFDREDWLGPVRGPLWCAMTWLIPMVLLSDDNSDELESGLLYLPTLAMHVMPRPAVFQKWLDTSVERLVALYPAPSEDPFQDLFGENKEERCGPFVPSEALDPEFPFKPDETSILIDRFLRNVRYMSNPLLKRPDVLREEGFVGTPYQFNQNR